MFGFTPFAKSPFAALGGNTYVVTLSESIALTDVSTLSIVSNQAVSETIVLSDVQSFTVSIKIGRAHV